MSEEQLVAVGQRLMQLPVATLTIVILLTLVSHPALAAYVSAAILAFHARTKMLALLREL